MQPASPSPLLLEARGITRTFPGVRALDGVDLSVRAGEVHALVGENGAGKSTLMHILSGALQPEAGEILLRGRPRRFPSPREAAAAGISIIHQELSLVPHLSVAENIFLGRLPRTRAGTVAWRRLRREAEAVLARLELALPLRAEAASFPLGIQQMVEIAKALSLDADLIIMDEPTSSLSEEETERLFRVIRRLRDRGKGIVYITHRMEEIYRIADRITVLRDGRMVGTAPAAGLPRDEMIAWMVGRKVERFYNHVPRPPGGTVLEARGVTLPAVRGERAGVEGVDLTVRAGEIVGLAGLRGAGHSELLGALFGRFGPLRAGTIRMRGRPVTLRGPRDALRHGMALVTNDRKASGLVMPLSAARNMVLASLRKAAPRGWITAARERALARPYKEALDLRLPSLDVEVWTLSGGNQQKVILGKWLMTEPVLFMLDEPTRGIDVGAKAEIYGLMEAWTRRGTAILLVTSDLPELLAMSDRVVVMRRGRVSAELGRGEATPRSVMAAAL